MQKKYAKIRSAVTAIIFISVIIFYFTASSYYNFKNVGFNGFGKDEIVKIYSERLYGLDLLKDLWSLTQKFLRAQLYDDSMYGYIIKDTSGKLHYTVPLYDVTADAEKTIRFSETVKKAGVPFVYIQAPDKVIEAYTVLPKGGYNYSNQNGDQFLRLLTEADVDTFDLREVMNKNDPDVEFMFYKTDHHWTTKAAFAAFAGIVNYLNINYGLDIDPENYYTDIKNYTLTEYKNCFLGSLGKRVGKFAVGLDDYTFIEPNFTTDYDVYITADTNTAPAFSGDFREAITKEHILNGGDIKLNKHAAYFEWDYGNLTIINKSIVNDIKLLLIKDSFSLPLAAFLSTCVKELHLIDVRGTTVSPAVYFAEHEFNAVVILYNPEVFGANMFNFGG